MHTFSCSFCTVSASVVSSLDQVAVLERGLLISKNSCSCGSSGSYRCDTRCRVIKLSKQMLEIYHTLHFESKHTRTCTRTASPCCYWTSHNLPTVCNHDCLYIAVFWGKIADIPHRCPPAFSPPWPSSLCVPLVPSSASRRLHRQDIQFKSVPCIYHTRASID